MSLKPNEAAADNSIHRPMLYRLNRNALQERSFSSPIRVPPIPIDPVTFGDSFSNGQKGLLSRWAARDRLRDMNANSTPTPVSGTQLTTSAVFDDLRDCKSFNLRKVGRGGGGRTHRPAVEAIPFRAPTICKFSL
jgi:hypothetical protein